MKIKKNYKILLIIFLIAVLGIAAFIHHEYNRTNAMSDDVASDYTLNAVDLIKEFEKDNINSSKKYVGKILQVKGSMIALEDDQAGNFTVILGSDSSLSKIRCSMDSTANIAELKSFVKDQKLSIKGHCSGYNPDDLGLGADVLLNKCLIAKK